MHYGGVRSLKLHTKYTYRINGWANRTISKPLAIAFIKKPGMPNRNTGNEESTSVRLIRKYTKSPNGETHQYKHNPHHFVDTRISRSPNKYRLSQKSYLSCPNYRYRTKTRVKKKDSSRWLGNNSLRMKSEKQY